MGSQSTVVAADLGYVVKRTPGRVHSTFDSAAAEAIRLTEQETGGRAFMVLKVVGVVAGLDMGRQHG